VLGDNRRSGVLADLLVVEAESVDFLQSLAQRLLALVRLLRSLNETTMQRTSQCISRTLLAGPACEAARS
jgi:hypothetical protein